MVERVVSNHLARYFTGEEIERSEVGEGAAHA